MAVTISEAYDTITREANKLITGEHMDLPPIQRMGFAQDLIDKGASAYMSGVWGGSKTDYALKTALKAMGLASSKEKKKRDEEGYENAPRTDNVPSQV